VTATAEPGPPPDDLDASVDWGWDRHGHDQRDAWLASTPVQRLAWLEDALRLASESGVLPPPGIGRLFVGTPSDSDPPDRPPDRP